MLPRIWTDEVITHQGTYYQIPPREVLPKPVQRPHPVLLKYSCVSILLRRMRLARYWSMRNDHDLNRISTHMSISSLPVAFMA